jgi:uncharacterized protein
MKVFLTGGTGFLGRHLVHALLDHGHEVTLLTRRPLFRGTTEDNLHVVNGDPTIPGIWQECIAGHDGVINLTGSSIFRLWTKKAQKEIVESRIKSTENIVNAISSIRSDSNMCLLNASGIGFYGYGHDLFDENTPVGDTFLAKTAQAWEMAALAAQKKGVRVVSCRLGIVLGSDGGALQKIQLLSKLHLGAPWGCGRQWVSWIHVADAVAAFLFLLEHEEIKGSVNFCAPNPVTNNEIMATVNRVIKSKPLIPSIPAWAMKLLIGEVSDSFLAGQRAIPQVLLENGFTFQFPKLEPALINLTR